MIVTLNNKRVFDIIMVPIESTIRIYYRDVIDADDITVILRIRLYGIDCPEYGQHHYQRAFKVLEELTMLTPLTLHVMGVDKHSRLLCRIFNSKGIDVCAEMVKRGHAWAMGDYQDLEKEAREAKRGLWKENNPVSPSEFKKMHPRRLS